MRRELIEALAGVMLFREIRENIRSLNGLQFVAKAGMGTRRTEQGSPRRTVTAKPLTENYATNA
jgi:hypothetical protein